ncbi:hypothetical protein GOHSU_02_02240 [Gordonia hirsuta DSM 44140 = NBRC 16056]|uniref:Uncharacterized protein n=1 Tax=Gordonia hirsuta DSM 44140 = NBRC 16056 TaxID=1121927 RepID=L7L5Q6_9ACTN|nr:hypothetical protein [Gordonia hirsuta]GAC56076.1 hypothetical protein GOHSU_02_02240 [Gordonia hirsuta DSM 44140 = NBRC 16056]
MQGKPTDPTTTGTGSETEGVPTGFSEADLPEGMTLDSVVDVDRDGIPDVAHVTDADGTKMNVYLDSEGEVLLVESDQDGDGNMDTVTYATEDGSIVQEVDVDGDGSVDVRTVSTADGQTYQVDQIEDGVVVSSTFDLDGDGVGDVSLVDLDGNGTLESAVLDLDGDGIADVVVSDLDGDGIPDSITTAYGGPDFLPDELSAPGEDSGVPYNLPDVDAEQAAVDVDDLDL